MNKILITILLVVGIVVLSGQAVITTTTAYEKYREHNELVEQRERDESDRLYEIEEERKYSLLKDCTQKQLEIMKKGRVSAIYSDMVSAIMDSAGSDGRAVILDDGSNAWEATTKVFLDCKTRGGTYTDLPKFHSSK